jgi:hypothetical protein
MTVEDVMSILATLDPKLRVVVNMSKNELANGMAVGKIETKKAYRYKSSDDIWKEEYYDDDDDDDYCYETVVNITG